LQNRHRHRKDATTRITLIEKKSRYQIGTSSSSKERHCSTVTRDESAAEHKPTGRARGFFFVCANMKTFQNILALHLLRGL
jgi:hypothetical protein